MEAALGKQGVVHVCTGRSTTRWGGVSHPMAVTPQIDQPAGRVFSTTAEIHCA